MVTLIHAHVFRCDSSCIFKYSGVSHWSLSVFDHVLRICRRGYLGFLSPPCFYSTAVAQSQQFSLTQCEPNPAATVISQIALVSQFLGVLSLYRNRNMILFSNAPNGSPVFFLLQHRQRSLQVPLWGIFLFFFFLRVCVSFLPTGIWRRSEFCISGKRTGALMDVMFPLEVFVYDSRYPFRRISLLHSVLLRNGLFVLRRIDLYTFL